LNEIVALAGAATDQERSLAMGSGPRSATGGESSRISGETACDRSLFTVAAGEALAGKMNSGGEQRQASHDVGIVSGAQ